MDGRVGRLGNELRHVEREERELKREEKALEGREHHLEQLEHGRDSWGEVPSMSSFHEIPMLPLTPHHTQVLNPSQDFGGLLAGLGAALKGQLDTMRHTGPAAHHRFKPLLPTHNILKPGAHPAHQDKAASGTKDEHHATH